MIDISSERVVTLTAATKHLPERRAGKRPNVATLYRWTNDGCRGVRLETIQVGACRCTSLEALQRFFDALTAAADSRPPAPRPPCRYRQRSVDAAEKRLATRLAQ